MAPNIETAMTTADLRHFILANARVIYNAFHSPQYSPSFELITEEQHPDEAYRAVVLVIRQQDQSIYYRFMESGRYPSNYAALLNLFRLCSITNHAMAYEDHVTNQPGTASIDTFGGSSIYPPENDPYRLIDWLKD